MRVLDLYAGAAGAGMGYNRAGMYVAGVDKAPQPNNPFLFLQMDALEVMELLIAGEDLPFMVKGDYWNISRFGLQDFDLIHASPPCQLFTMYNNVKSIAKSTSENYENLIPDTRRLLEKSGKSYVIENVPRAPLEDYFQLCGTSFGIRVRRHRIFETNWGPITVPPCDHKRFTDKIFPGSSNRPNGRTVCNIGEYRVPLGTQKDHMQVDWPVTLHELSEMVPPVMTEHIGRQFIATIERPS